MLPGIDLIAGKQQENWVVVGMDLGSDAVVLTQGENRVTIPLAYLQLIVDEMTLRANQLAQARQDPAGPDGTEPDDSAGQ